MAGHHDRYRHQPDRLVVDKHECSLMASAARRFYSIVFDRGWVHHTASPNREEDHGDFGVIAMEIIMALVLVAAGGFLTYLALDAVRRAK